MNSENIKKEENLVTRLVVEKLIPHGVCKEAYAGFFPKEYLLVGKDGKYGYAAPEKGVLVSCLFDKAEVDDDNNYIFSRHWDTNHYAVHVFDKDMRFVGAKYV